MKESVLGTLPAIRTLTITLVVVPMIVLTGPAVSSAQAPSAPRDIVSVVDTMRAMAEALGVDCSHCHVEGQGGRLNYRSEDNPKKQVAREMIAMTADINRMLHASGRPARMQVDCLTCHRGVPVPRQLVDILRETTIQRGGTAAAEQYRALRKEYYGRQSYDFSEDALLGFIQGFIESRPDDAIALLQMALEFNPQSSRTYSALAFAYTRKLDDASAVRALEKALEIDPNNNIARGQLEQLKNRRRK